MGKSGCGQLCLYYVYVTMAIAEGIFEGVNAETDKRDKERKTSYRKTSASERLFCYFINLH